MRAVLIRCAVFALAIEAMLACGGHVQPRNSPASNTGDCPTLSRTNVAAPAAPGRVSGRLRDPMGVAIVATGVVLAPGPGTFYTNFNGGFGFPLSAGSYSVAPMGECAFAPPSASVDATSGNGTLDFTADDGCVTATQSNVVGSGSVFSVSRAGARLGSTRVSVEQEASAGAAKARLQDILAEVDAAACNLTIDGSPAIERRAQIASTGILTADAGQDSSVLALTTAIALESSVVRFESQVAGSAPSDVSDLFLAAARSFTADELTELRAAGTSP